MDLRHMRHFIAVAEELHFGRAARRLHIEQPPLSQSIRRLEQDLGVELFDRSRRSVKLTAAGQVFLIEARRTLRHAELARKMAQREAAKMPELRVSFIGPALYRVLPDLLVRHRASAPQVSVRLFEDASPAQVEGIFSGDYDMGFVAAGTELPEDCETLLVERAPVVAAVPADWPVAAQDTVTLVELARQPFILPPQKYAAQSSETLSMFKKAGVMPHVTQEATQTNTTLSLVGAGLGCSMVTATAALAQPRNVKFLPIADDVATRYWEMTMIWHPERLNALAGGFLATVRDYISASASILGLNASGR